jgi:hypothetical protein
VLDEGEEGGAGSWPPSRGWRKAAQGKKRRLGQGRPTPQGVGNNDL